MIRLLLAILLSAGAVSHCSRAEEVQAAPVEEWAAAKHITAATIESWGGEDACFVALPIDSTKAASMIAGGSYPAEGALISLDELRCLHVLHVNLDRDTLCGEMICNAAIAADLLDIFRELFHQSYPIELMVPIDEYGAVDEDSMRANNSSSFCYRVIAGSTRTVIQPATAEPYVDRKADYPYKIDENDAAYKLFIAHGFTWGGSWTSLKDYQHFEK